MKEIKGWAAMNKGEFELDNISFYNTKKEMTEVWEDGEQQFVKVKITFEV